MPSDPGSCVGGPDCFLITLCSDKTKSCLLKSMYVESGCIQRRSGLLEIGSSQSGYRVHLHPGDSVCDPVAHRGRILEGQMHLNGAGDSERKCAISLRISHHFSLELNIIPSWKNHLKIGFLPVSYSKPSPRCSAC